MKNLFNFFKKYPFILITILACIFVIAVFTKKHEVHSTTGMLMVIYCFSFFGIVVFLFVSYMLFRPEKFMSITGKITEWSKVFGAPIQEVPQRPNRDRIFLSYRLIEEESRELQQELFDYSTREKEAADLIPLFRVMLFKMGEEEKASLIEKLEQFKPLLADYPPEVMVKDHISLNNVADALADTLWVVHRAIFEFGFNADELIQIIYQSNMSKACKDEVEALQTVDEYRKNGINAHHVKVGNYWIVRKDEDNKILKSINWKQPIFPYEG